MRRTYGESRQRTSWKFAIALATYGFTFTLAILSVFAAAFLWG